jgi:hypothetical protein
MFDFCVNNVYTKYHRYASMRAIESPSTLDDQQWLTYWVLYSFITLFELSTYRILYWYVVIFMTNNSSKYRHTQQFDDISLT